MTNEKKLELIEEMFDVDAGTITPETELESIEEWSSLTKLSLIVMLDDECGKTINNDIIKSLRTVQDIMDLMD